MPFYSCVFILLLLLNVFLQVPATETPGNTEVNQKMNLELTSTKTWLESHQRVFIIGGGSSNTVNVFDSRTEKWSRGRNMNSARNEHSAVLVEGRIFVIGGVKKGERTSDVDIYDPAEDSWTPTRSLSTPRSTFGAASVNGSIYVCGGGIREMISSEFLDTCEWYSSRQQRWAKMPSMKVKRADFAMVELGGILYAIGGFDGGRRLSSVESWDWRRKTSSWSSVVSMLTGRDEHSAAVLEGKIFVAGGEERESSPLKSVEMFDPRRNQWTSVGSLRVGRSRFGMVSVKGLLFAFGGQGGCRSVEVYNPLKNEWSEWSQGRKLELPECKREFASAVVVLQFMCRPL